MRRPFVILACAAACTGRSDVDLTLAVGADVKSAILAIEHPDGLEVRALDLTAGSASLPLLDQYIGKYEVRLTVVEYRASLDELQIAPGTIPPATSGKPIPRGHERIREAIVRGGFVGAWEDRDEVGGRLATFRMGGSTIEDCLDGGGCFDADVADGQVCQTPCPTSGAPETPDAPAPPEITCPVGWSPITAAGTTVCSPFAGGVPTCPPLSGVVPGETGCRVPGAACPAGDWPEGLTADVVYVRPGASGGGTRANPYGSIADAVQTAGANATIALSKGTHEGDVTLPGNLTIAGACATETRVTTTAADAVFSVGGGSRVTIRDVHLSGAREGVEVDGTDSLLTLSGVVITDTGRAAIDVGTRAAFEADDILIGPNTVRALRVTGRGTANVRRAVMDRTVRLAIYAQTEGSVVNLTDVAIIDTQPDPNDDDQFGRAIDVERGGELTAERVFVTRSHNLAVFVSDESHVSITDGVVQDTQSRADNGAFGDAIHILRGGRVELERVWLDGNRRHQIFATAEVATATLTDVVITRSLAEANGGEGSAVRAYGTSRIHLFRSVVDTTRVSALVARDADSLLTLEDVRITGASMATDATGAGSAVRAESGGRVVLDRVLIERTAGRAVAIEKDSSGTVDHLTVDDAGSATCLVCSGLCADEGTIVARDVAVAGAYGRAVNASDVGSSVSVERLAIRSSFPAPSCTTSFRSPLKGDGAGSIDGGRLVLSDFLIEDQPGAGLVVEDFLSASTAESGVFARDGLVRRSGIGANVLVEDYPLIRVTDRVLYEDNESNLNFTLE